MMVELKDFGKMPFNIYAVSTKSNDEFISVRFGFDLGGAYLNSKDHPEKYKLIEKPPLKHFFIGSVTLKMSQKHVSVFLTSRFSRFKPKKRL